MRYIDYDNRVNLKYVFFKMSGANIGHSNYDFPEPKDQVQLVYRPDIDGLRALAVIFVVLFHAYPRFLPGGFIGVDIFFVISGFLISTIILRETESRKFSFAEFYNRRIRRIFPALFTVMLVSIIFGFFVLLPSEFQNLGKHIAAGAGFVSNLLLWNESGYFDQSAEVKPFLHLWSLGIEEQFYLIFPLLIYFAVKQKISATKAILAIAFFSFAYNVAIFLVHPVAAFYSPLTRFWEIMVGSLLAALSFSSPNFLFREKNRHSDLQSLTGLSLIFIGLFLITNENAFPGFWALLPTLGAGLLISAGPNAKLNFRLLSNPILVWIGLISFPLYLWHWVLISFLHIFRSHPKMETITTSIFLSVLLAWLTYRLIEKPLRLGTTSRRNTYILLWLMAGLGVTGAATYYFTSPSLVENRDGMIDCEEGTLCEFGNPKASKQILVYGDSHIAHFSKALNEALGDQYKFLYVTVSGCFLGDKVKFIAVDGDTHRKDCDAGIEVLRGLREQKFFAVIRAQRWHSYDIKSAVKIQEAIQDSIDAFGIHPEKTIIVGSTSNIDLPCNQAKALGLPWRSHRTCREDKETQDPNKEFIEVTKSLAVPKNVYFVYPYQQLCPNDRCIVISNGRSNFEDRHHLSKVGALQIMPEIKKYLELKEEIKISSR
jgi:peptidoglycan/LPS O-acetylase OafA/YrhL